MLAAATSAQAEVEISGNVALTSDYKFRGISQSNEDIAIQGGFDVAFENGIYIGTWGSTVDFDFSSADGGYNGSLELAKKLIGVVGAPLGANHEEDAVSPPTMPTQLRPKE